ncbi:MAG: hypothetical protein ACK53Y_21005 [bacterium]
MQGEAVLIGWNALIRNAPAFESRKQRLKPIRMFVENTYRTHKLPPQFGGCFI